MKFTIDTAAFAEAALFAAKAINTRPPNPVLSGLLIEAVEGTLRLSGFDYTISNRTTVAADVMAPGHALVSGRMLTDILSKLPKSKPVTLELDGSKVTLSSGRANYQLAAMPYEQFPDMPELPAIAGTVNGSLFADAVSSVAGAASTDDALAFLTAIFITTDGNKITMQATDRYRMAQRIIDWAPTNPAASQRWLIKAKTLVEVSKLAAGELTLMASDSMVGFRTGNRATTTLMTEGDYPKISSLFPDYTPNMIVADQSTIVETVDRVALVAEANTSVRLASADGELTIDAGTGEGAQGMEIMDAELTGDNINAAFNPGYLSWALKTVHTNTVNLGFTDPRKPCLVTPTDDTDLKILVMPIRLPGK